jgi:hypothetical protein
MNPVLANNALQHFIPNIPRASLPRDRPDGPAIKIDGYGPSSCTCLMMFDFSGRPLETVVAVPFGSRHPNDSLQPDCTTGYQRECFSLRPKVSTML